MSTSILDEALHRIGGLPITIIADQATVRVSWRRSYSGIASDEREIIATTIDDGLRAVIDWEDGADAFDGGNG